MFVGTRAVTSAPVSGMLECAPRLPEAALDGVEEQHPPSEVHKLVRTRHLFLVLVL